MDINKFDVLIIGSGLSGSTLAYKYAMNNQNVLVLEKRNHIGGNVYDHKQKGINIHLYGPHIFHTNNEKVYKFMNKFWKLNNFKNKVQCLVKDKIIPIPFNFKGIDVFWPKNKAQKIKDLLISIYGFDKKIFILELKKQKNPLLKEVAQFVYKNIFENYTTKMWGKKPEEIDPYITSRVPIYTSYNENYFTDKYEGIPEKGYSNAIHKMLDHPNIKVILETDASKKIVFKDKKIFFLNQEVKIPIIYSGAIDELFNYKFGVLNYRSLNIQFKTFKQKSVQDSAVLNLPDHPTITRNVEYKKMTLNNTSNYSIVSYEEPNKYDLNNLKFNEPYYPMGDDESRQQYHKYQKIAQNFSNLHFVGRLATYSYLNMDKTILQALSLFEKIFSKKEV